MLLGWSPSEPACACLDRAVGEATGGSHVVYAYAAASEFDDLVLVGALRTLELVEAPDPEGEVIVPTESDWDLDSDPL